MHHSWMNDEASWFPGKLICYYMEHVYLHVMTAMTWFIQAAIKGCFYCEWKSEWGMRSFQASYPRVKNCFIWEEIGGRQIVLTMMILLVFNYWANKVGISQNKNTYMKPLEQMGNIYYADWLFLCQMIKDYHGDTE